MRLKLFAFGKLKTPGLRDAADYYAGLVNSWLPLEEIELKPLVVTDKDPGTRKQIQTKEGELLLERMDRALPKRALIFLLDEGGKNLPTSGWADLVRNWERDSVPEVAFCIGSSLGFSDAVRKRAHGRLSLGAQTLPHELARVVLLEQLYRCWGVTRGHPYHNEGT